MSAPAGKAEQEQEQQEQQQQQQKQQQSKGGSSGDQQPQLWFPRRRKANGNWRNKERDAKARAETTKHIDRLIESGEASQKLPVEYRNRLSKVVPYLENCLYLEAPNLEYYQDVSTLCERLQRLFAQQQQHSKGGSSGDQQPQLWFPRRRKANGNWRNKERDAKERGAKFRHIHHVLQQKDGNGSRLKLPKEYLDFRRLMEVCQKLELYLYQKAPSLEAYCNESTFNKRLEAIVTDIRYKADPDHIELLIRDDEKRIGRTINGKGRREYYREVITNGEPIALSLDTLLKDKKENIEFHCDIVRNSCSKDIELIGRCSMDDIETEGASSMIIKALEGKKNLKALHIADCTKTMVSDAILAAMNGGRILDYLELDECNVEAGASAIRDAMANTKSLVFQDIFINDSFAKSLSEGLEENGVLSFLKIDNVGQSLDYEAAAELARGLKSNTSLKTLWLSFTRNDEAIKAVLEALTTNRTLTKLHLHAHFVKAGALAIQNFLSQNKTLQSLELLEQHRNVDLPSVKVIASSLAKTSTLQRLQLVGWKFWGKGAIEISNAMMKNWSCTELVLGQVSKTIPANLLKKIARLTEINKICSNREEAMRQKALEFGSADTSDALPTSSNSAAGSSSIQPVVANTSRPTTTAAIANTAAATTAATTAKLSNTGHTIVVDPQSAADTSQAAVITPTNAPGTTKPTSSAAGSNSEDDTNASIDRTSTVASNSNKVEPEPWIEAMLSRIPDDVLLQHVRKRKIIDLSTDEDNVQQPDGSGTALQNLISQNEKHAAKLMKVKEEKADAEESLAAAKEDMEDQSELIQQQSLFTDKWQTKFDDLAKLAEDGPVDSQKVNEIRYRS